MFPPREDIPVAVENATSSVWEAEHGASSPATSEPEGANAGHRFRIHGRLAREMPEHLRPGEPGGQLPPGLPEGEQLRDRLAQATEMDLSDVRITVQDREIVLSGTVADEGERLQLQDLVGQLTDGRQRLISQLRARNP
jgi:hypothetical protein